MHREGQDEQSTGCFQGQDLVKRFLGEITRKGAVDYDGK